jgi:ABC-type phosphate/phosphonate transport system substrate-binding protein
MKLFRAISPWKTGQAGRLDLRFAKRTPRPMALAAYILGTLAALTGVSPAQQGAAGKVVGAASQAPGGPRLRGVASSRVFNHVNRNDARAALKVWYDEVAKQRGYVLDSTVDIVDSVAEIRERLESHSVELVTMGVPDYLELESSNLLAPVLTDSRSSQGGALYSYVLVVNASSPAASAGSLRGRNVLVWARGSGGTGMAWLEVLLGKEKLGRSASFFASVKAVDKPQACILPVFFGVADACVVDEVNLNLAREMNPQLAQLRVLARSRPMIESIVAVPSEPKPYKEALIESMLSLHEDPRGRQLLMVFKTERMVRIQPGDLDSARELWRDYNRLTGFSPKHPAGSGPAPSASNAVDRGKEGH